MILHLVTDEKFTDYAISQFSAPEMMSEFVLVPSNFNSGVKVNHVGLTRIIIPWSDDFYDLLTRLGEYDAILFHGLLWGQWQSPVLRAIPENVKVAWMCWAGEIFSRNDLNRHFTGTITNVICDIRKLTGRTGKVDVSWQVPVELYEKVDFCLTGEEAVPVVLVTNMTILKLQS